MKRLLFLSPHLPSPFASEGGHISIFRNLEILSQIYEIDLVCFRNRLSSEWSTAPVEKLCRSAAYFPVTDARRILWSIRNPSLPLLAAARASSDCAKYISRLIANRKFDRVHLEGHQMAVYAESYKPIPRRTVYVHDIFSQNFVRRIDRSSGLFKRLLKIEAERLRKWERIAFDYLTEIYVPSQKDWQLLFNLNSVAAARAKVVPLYFNLFHPRSDIPTGNPVLVYWGAYSRIENVDAVRFLMDDIFPIIRNRITDVKIRLAGANPPVSFGSFSSPQVDVTGYVEDPGAVLRSCSLALLPLRLGAGVKIKVLELLSAGVPVVTTPVGAEGIPCEAGDGLIVVPDASATGLANAAIDLLSDPVRLFRLSGRAAAWARLYAANKGDIL